MCVRLCVYVSRYLEVCNVSQRGPIRYANWIPTVAYLSEFWIGSDWPSSLLPHYLIYLPSPPSLPRSHFLSSFSFNPSFLPSPSSPHGAYSISSLPPLTHQVFLRSNRFWNPQGQICRAGPHRALGLGRPMLSWAHGLWFAFSRHPLVTQQEITTL